MQKIAVKFCGLTRAEDVETALSVGANFLGFIVECKSPRRLSVSNAARLAVPIKGLAKSVAVTVNPDDILCNDIRARMDPNFLQLHGKETPTRAAEIKRNTGIGIIKALSVGSKADLEFARSFENIADYLLLDAKPPEGSEQRGGHGIGFDWTLLQNHGFKTPIIVAGGLNPVTVATAKERTKSAFFDVSSGIEVSPGIKDPQLMAQFIKAARNE